MKQRISRHDYTVKSNMPARKGAKGKKIACKGK